VKLTPSRRLYILGIVMLPAFFVWDRYRGYDGPALFFAPLAVAGVAYLLTIRELARTPKFTRRVVFICLGLSLLWRIPYFLTPVGTLDDLHRYVWDGRLQRLGYNPYKAIPADPALAYLHTPETRELNNPNLPSPYPPGAQLFFRVVTALHESAFAFKVAFLACDLGIMLVLLTELRRTGEGEHWVLAYAWNPLLVTEVAGSSHIDIFGVLLLLVSAVALGRRWRAIAAVTFALAIAVKLLPIVLLPLYWKRVRVRDGALAALVLGLLYLPFLDHGRIPTGSLGTYIQSFRFNDPVFAMLQRVAAPQVVAAFAVLVGLGVATWLSARFKTLSSHAFAWPMAASLLCAPVVYPWYLVWLLPFLRSTSTLPLIIWTVSILPAYYVWHLRELGRPWIVPGWILLLEYGSVAVTVAIMLLRRRIRTAAPPGP
jgi:hypothetical protein